MIKLLTVIIWGDEIVKAQKLTEINELSVVYQRRDYEYNMNTFHYHDSYEIYFLEEGKRMLFIGDKIYETERNDAALFSPNVFHYSNGKDSHAGTCISFTENYLDEYFTPKAKDILLRCFSKDVISLTENEMSRIKELASNMGADGDIPFSRLSEILRLLAENIERGSEKKRLSSVKGIPPIISYINENYDTISGLDDIANNFYMSKCYLCRKFKNDTGMTVTQYINHVRIQKSCELLAATDMTIAQISISCGYDSQAYYSRVFRHTMNCAPIEFRMRMRDSVKAYVEK